MIRAAAVMLLALCAGAAHADVLGTIQLQDGSIVYLTNDRPDECQRYQRVEWRNVAGELQQEGCFARHNTTLVLMWIGGPAEAVPLNIVRWVLPEAEPEPIKKPVRGTS